MVIAGLILGCDLVGCFNTLSRHGVKNPEPKTFMENEENDVNFL